MTRKEYLRRPSIEGVIYQIGTDEIQVWDDHTIFIQIRNCHRIALSEVQGHFRELQKVAQASGKVKLAGSTKFMPAVRQLYPAYCAACDRIETLFSELTELVLQIKQDGLHMGCSEDELLKAATQKQSEIAKYYYLSSEYSRFLDYDKRVCDALSNRPWEDDEIIAFTIPIA